MLTIAQENSDSISSRTLVFAGITRNGYRELSKMIPNPYESPRTGYDANSDHFRFSRPVRITGFVLATILTLAIFDAFIVRYMMWQTTVESESTGQKSDHP